MEEESEEEEAEEEEEEQEEHEPEEAQPQPTPLGDVPLLTYPIQSVPGSSSEHPPIWDQILNNQIAMQGQLNTLNRHQEEMNRRQRKMEYKLNHYFIYTGFSVDSPPTTPTDDWGSFSYPYPCFILFSLRTMLIFKCGGGIGFF